MSVNLIAAVGNQGQIGYEGKLPWDRPKDLELFAKLTNGGVVIAGYRTWRSLPELPGRKLLLWNNRTIDEVTPGAFLERVIADNPEKEVWIVGGGRTYAEFAPFINGLFIISRIDYDGVADKYFPFDAFSSIKWRAW